MPCTGFGMVPVMPKPRVVRLPDSAAVAALLAVASVPAEGCTGVPLTCPVCFTPGGQAVCLVCGLTERRCGCDPASVGPCAAPGQSAGLTPEPPKRPRHGHRR